MASLSCLLSFLGSCQSSFAATGILLVLFLLARTLYIFGKNVYVYFLAERLGKTVDFRKFGKWAVVTGATDGIGKGYALDLARRGCDIVLISRSEDKLNSVAKEIASKHDVLTRIVVADFGSDERIYEKIRTELEGLEIGTLVNNVGMALLYPDIFHRAPGGIDAMLKMIRVNCVAQTMMTRIILPQMVARNKGIIIHLSSAAGNIPIPLLAEYSATKAYNDFLGRALQHEYNDKGIISQVIFPYGVATNMSGRSKTNLFMLNAEAYARSCLNSVGFFSRTNGHPSHCIQNWIFEHLPSGIFSKVLRKIMEKGRTRHINKLKETGEYKGE
ncbi:very-long-chain 3-oxoacyl-CoA reductase-like [Paramacrobiotus metropolitanus]|uniref:very-long-chain 3-oxoacyl-CoA reductase-like n=1 Tax=Paramacrobiotus metropolitanus TaxID=2943436 RepID=UPI002445A275|nr:very-long-chain 3-oxoacyl-CoA reductase-like [Paramacrobiotus metropolitanus]